MQNNSNRWVDCIFLPLATTAENHARVANRFAVHSDDIAILRTAYVLHEFRARKFARIVERVDVPTLQGNHLAKLLQRLAGDDELLGIQLALRHGIRGSAEVKHPAREFETQFSKIVRPASAQDIEDLDHFKRIADVRSERLIHIRD